MTRLLTITAIGAALALAACGGDDDASPSGDREEAAAETTTTTEEPAEQESGSRGGSGNGSGGGSGGGGKPAGIEISTEDSQFGQVLFDGDGRAIYYFDLEQREESECYGDCAEAWPPVLTDGEPQAGGRAKPGLLGTTERRGGQTQVTYDGRPLYYYVDDPAGEVLCHNVEGFGGLWLAVQPNGEPVPQ